ncbi:plasmid replication initiator [Roseomonas sp. KE2513]|uniref:replication protein RepA n=1 Tax=Roseomonas sp. KE2513 TaxID=2479202 RepID=UPI0018DF107E|nr:replication protein RepA [Roseomonas sp. KE2513]MBI0539044.1 plasmid replication initiator [Roseomonas sp. KE2513]
MGTVHDLLEAKGKQQALLQSGLDRREIEAAAAYLADEDSGIGFLYSGWCQAALPHRRLPDSQGWQITGERVTLVVEPGMKAGAAGKPVHIGVPYGSRARLILLYLQSEALRTGSREIELGKSLRGWLLRLGIPVGGKSVEAVREQAERISRCKLTFEVKAGISKGLVNQTIVDTALFLDLEDETQGSLFVERARLSEGFFEQLKKHPVPLEEAAIKALNNNSMALDIYAWLAYRLHALKGPTPVSWRALRPQFGMAFGRMDNFRARYLDNLKLALAVYPMAKVEVDESGLTLHPSRPPVVPRAKSSLR